MIDFGSWLEAKAFEDPIDLLFFAPHDIPIVSFGFLPLAVVKSLVDTVAEGSSEFDVVAD